LHALQLVTYERTAHTRESKEVLGKLKGVKDVVLMQTIHCDFSWKVFLEQFLLHLLMPFSLPFFAMTTKQHYQLMKKQMFMDAKPLGLFVSHLLPLMLWTQLLLFIIYYRVFRSEGIQDWEMIGCLLLHFLRSAMVACKYALLRADEYNKYVFCIVLKLFVPRTYHAQHKLPQMLFLVQLTRNKCAVPSCADFLRKRTSSRRSTGEMRASLYQGG
jgi:hypothetical protein